MDLQRLPPEIRQYILHLVICSPNVPISPSASQKRRKTLIPRVWQIPPQNPALPLLLVNQQFQDDTKSVLLRIRPEYDLDIMFVNKSGLWTTWTIPKLPPTQCIDTLYATFRLFQRPDDLKSRFRSGYSFALAPNGPDVGCWSFYGLLVAFLQAGPGCLSYQMPRRPLARREHCSTHAPYVVKQIVINVLSPADSESYEHVALIWNYEEVLDNPFFRGGFFIRDDHAPKKPEERLAAYMANHLETILKLSYTTMDYGMILYECVSEHIILQVNGKEVKRFDMEQLRKDIQVAWWGETPSSIEARQRAFSEWREWLDERMLRAKDGLEFDTRRPHRRIM